MNPIDTSGIKSTIRVDSERPLVNNKAGSTQNRDRATSGDKVELTDTASQLSKLSEDLASVDGVDNARIEAIRQQIAEGRYEVDPDRIAGALLQLEKELS